MCLRMKMFRGALPPHLLKQLLIDWQADRWADIFRWSDWQVLLQCQTNQGVIDRCCRRVDGEMDEWMDAGKTVTLMTDLKSVRRWKKERERERNEGIIVSPLLRCPSLWDGVLAVFISVHVFRPDRRLQPSAVRRAAALLLRLQPSCLTQSHQKSHLLSCEPNEDEGNSHNPSLQQWSHSLTSSKHKINIPFLKMLIASCVRSCCRIG